MDFWGEWVLFSICSSPLSVGINRFVCDSIAIKVASVAANFHAQLSFKRGNAT
jgi:hypothetical protein